MDFSELHKERGVIMYDVTKTVQIIKETAKKKGISTGAMLEEVGLNKNTLSSMNSRKSWIASDGLAKIADYLNVSVDYLLGRDIKNNAPEDDIRSVIIERVNRLTDSQLDRLLGYLEALTEE